MRVILFNWFHAGDIILSRSIIADVLPLLQAAGHTVELRCKPERKYLWADLGVPISDSEWMPAGVASIDLWFGHFHDILKQYGLTSENQIATWNRQARTKNLPVVTTPPKQHISLPEPKNLPKLPARYVLVENGPVLSGQTCWDLTDLEIVKLADENPGWFFLYSAAPKVLHPRVVDCSSLDLLALSYAGRKSAALISRLSGVTVSFFTRDNQHKPKLVAGSKFIHQIWDATNFWYAANPTILRNHLKTVLQKETAYDAKPLNEAVG